MSKDTNDLLQLFKTSIVNIAHDQKVKPRDVTRRLFREYNAYENLNSSAIDKCGGFANIKNLLFPKENQNLVVQSAVKHTRNFRNKLEKAYGDSAFFSETISEAIKEAIKANPPRLHKPLKKKAAKNYTSSRSIVVNFSDTHFGCNISSSEVGGINEYNWTIAARRSAMVAEQIMNYKPEYRDQTDLVLVFNGDMMAGIIHDQEWAVDLMTTQFAGTLDIFSQMVSYLANGFQRVRVYCNTGNHSRRMHKSNRGRQSSMKWDSFESDVYVALKLYLEAIFDNCEVIIPESPYTIFDVQGNKVFATHGDTVLNVGNPGSSINIRSISNQINKLNSSLAKNNNYEANIIMVGHVHTPMVQLVDNGTYLVINGCLSGTDPFANSIGIFESNPTQLLFESTKDHAVGDIRLIQVKEADNKKVLDKIIKPFKSPF